MYIHCRHFKRNYRVLGAMVNFWQPTTKVGRQFIFIILILPRIRQVFGLTLIEARDFISEHLFLFYTVGVRWPLVAIGCDKSEDLAVEFLNIMTFFELLFYFDYQLLHFQVPQPLGWGTFTNGNSVCLIMSQTGIGQTVGKLVSHWLAWSSWGKQNVEE